jgi:rhodanese-related sulfurtransferase
MEINVNFESEILESGINKQDAIFLICRSGNRSSDAAELLTSRGFTNCFNVKDGFEGEIGPNHQRSTINGWKYSKLPWKQ